MSVWPNFCNRRLIQGVVMLSDCELMPAPHLNEAGLSSFPFRESHFFIAAGRR